MNTRAILLAAALLSGCGSGEDSAPPPQAQDEWKRTANGYPIVEGEYTMLVNALTWQCIANGVKGDVVIIPEFAMRMNVTQADSSLTFENMDQSVDDDPIFKVGPVISDDIILHKNAHFNRTRARKATLVILEKNFDGVMTLVMNGDFTKAGWKGTYEYSIFVSNAEVFASMSCKSSSTTFTGERETPKA